ncbi:unnamed protein product [Linum trigynum]|uniref:Uncharacterized protein n=1 Tax=Linum trigynum TaxID=586398 RepID=A0AAV2EKB2_9ROSI
MEVIVPVHLTLSRSFSSSLPADDHSKSQFYTLLTSMLSRRRQPITTVHIDHRPERVDLGDLYFVLEHASELKSLSVNLGVDGYDLGVIAPYIRHHRRQYDPLETLRLERAYCGFVEGTDSYEGFNKLTTLELHDCRLYSPYDGQTVLDVDPFATLPLLKHAKMVNCISSGPVRVTGPELLTLEIVTVGPAVVLGHDMGFERERPLQLGKVSAPRLESFRFSGRVSDLPSVLLLGGEVRFPSLERARVELVLSEPVDEQLRVLGRAFRDMMAGLRNAESLDLCFDLDKKSSVDLEHCKRSKFPLTAVKSTVSDFTRLKTLKIRYPENELPNVSYQEIQCRFEGSSCVEETITCV